MAKTKHKSKPRLLEPTQGRTTEAEIETLLANGVPASTDAVTRLRRKDIEVAADGVFQWRNRRDDPARKGRNIAALKHAFGIQGKPFDPLSVFPAGGRYFVIDGHHRLAAYEAAGWEGLIPIKVFEGSLADARIAALNGNRKDKLA